MGATLTTNPTSGSDTDSVQDSNDGLVAGAASLQGLSPEQVRERVAEGAVNINAGVKTRSIGQIFRENLCTLFNAINIVLAVLVFLTGSYKNEVFLFVIVCNVVIGIVQEIRSKKTTDALSIVASSKVQVVRGGSVEEIPVDGIVRDDIIILGRGDQVPADSVVVSGTCDANESLLTGESDLIKKKPGDHLMSGSFVNAGKVYARVEHVGAENYAARITAEAKARKKVNSEMMDSLNKLIRFVTFTIVPVGLALYARETLVAGTSWDAAILSTVAAVLGMIPEGLILLTSMVLAVAVTRLAKSHVLVQQLYCIEALARVDVLCLDKTGTITTGAMEVSGVEPVSGKDVDEVNRALTSLIAADEDPNDTSRAIAAYVENQQAAAQKCVRIIPFSSDKKWSGGTFADGTSYVMGAGQFIMGDAFSRIAAQAEKLAATARVLLVARVDGFDAQGAIEGTPVPLGFVSIHDQIRPTAAQTIGYFKDQGVSVNVISGDDPRTVAGIARQVGVVGADKYVDATTLKTDTDIEDAIRRYHVFGRVKPEQKKAFVLAYQKAGHTVAMTGDGVNDTLALKAADCSVAMASGSDAARNVATLVLVDNDFASMPKVVAEGRRSINNLQRSASLFLVKTLMSMALAALYLVLPWEYPFQPIQMTLISATTIGLPSFVLALEPNHERVQGRFLENVIVRSLPGAFCVVATVMAVNCIGYMGLHLSYADVSTLCVLLTGWVGFMLVFRLSIPFTPIRVALCIVILVLTALGATVFANLFVIARFNLDMCVVFGIAAAVVTVVFQVLYTIMDRLHANYLAKSAKKRG